MTYPTTFIVTGAESSGKTTLATQLSNALSAPLVTEIARDYLLNKPPPYHYKSADLLTIGKLQYQQEIQQAEALSPAQGQPLICDTDLLVIIIWSEVKFGWCDPWLEHTFERIITESPKRHYFLCDWHIPWQKDPLREHPEEREALYSRYLNKLQVYQLDYTLLAGNQQQRLNLALNICKKNILL